MIRRCWRAWLLLVVMSASVAFVSLAFANVAVQSVRTGEEPSRVRVVFDLSGPVEHRVYHLGNPDRVVIDLAGAVMAAREVPVERGLLQAVRSAAREGGELRIVLDVNQAVHVQSYLVRPHQDLGYRLVVDLRPKVPQRPPPSVARVGQLLVAIDPGHGGRDPGAIGPGGTHEKDVVLEVARKLATLLDREPGFSALLTRDDDVFVSLQERRQIARQAGADLFISVHADAVNRGGPRGSSVYTLSGQRASQEQNRILVGNSSERLAGLDGGDRDPLLRTMLVDLSRGATLEFSNDLAGELLQSLSLVGPVHKSNVERAGFAVLRSLDMPSVLVELAFISNPHEERLLRDAEHQWRLARALRDGLVAYGERQYPGLTVSNGQGFSHHRVQPGETLTGIARRYDVSVAELRAINRLAGDRIEVGSRLRVR
jgi:N-acetylmuramoyl-L-alanine amidase